MGGAEEAELGLLAADDPAVLQGIADEEPFPFLLIGLEGRPIRDHLDDGAPDVRLFPEVGLFGRDLDLPRSGRRDLGRGGQGHGRKKKDESDDGSFLVHADHLLRGLSPKVEPPTSERCRGSRQALRTGGRR